MIDKKVYLSNLEWIKVKGEWLGEYNNLGIVRGNITIKDGISYEEFSKLLDNTFYILSNHKLQSNWNSLREYIKNKDNWYYEIDCNKDKKYIFININDVLDKMNELEGEKDNGISNE